MANSIYSLALRGDVIDLILINTIIPLKFLYLKSIDKLNETDFVESIRQLNPEKNSIIDKWKALGLDPESAYQTQALLQLKNEYCILSDIFYC